MMPRLGSLLLLALTLAPAVHAAEPAVDYPKGYRQWPHVKSMVIYSDKHPLFASFGGMHHIYANADAMRAYTKGGTFADGSVIVFDLLDAKDDGGAWVAGDRKLVGVMVKNRTRYKATGGWGFEGFKGDSQTDRMVTDANAQCFACHQKQKDNDFVFSGYRP
jgi:Cytochrome P460